MSLRRFHLIFVAVAVVLCLATSWHSFQLAQMGTSVPFQEMGGGLLLIAMALTGYAGWLFRRKNVNYFAIAAALLTLPEISRACAVCIPDTTTKAVQALNQGTSVLLSFTGVMLFVMATSLIRLIRRAG